MRSDFGVTVWKDEDVEILVERIQFALSEMGISLQIRETPECREYRLFFMEKLGRGEKEDKS